MIVKQFIKYQHIEKTPSDATDGLLDGLVYVFPKLDGTNGSVWFDGEVIRAGSRKRLLSVGSDNKNFYKQVLEQDSFKKLFKKHPDWRLYGEWLVPHTIKTYHKNAWRKFYVFDVVVVSEDLSVSYIPFEEYSEELTNFDIKVIPYILKGNNITEEKLKQLTLENNYLIDKEGDYGEGIVIKRYDFVNRFGNTVWGKMKISYFKELQISKKQELSNKYKKSLELDIAINYTTQEFLQKTKAKIVNQHGAFLDKHIKQFLNTVYHDVVVENIWGIIKKNKQPIIDFNVLRREVIKIARKFLGY